MEDDKAANPTYVGAFGAEAKMAHPDNISNLIEKFWSWHRCRRILWDEMTDLSGANFRRVRGLIITLILYLSRRSP